MPAQHAVDVGRAVTFGDRGAGAPDAAAPAEDLTVDVEAAAPQLPKLRRAATQTNREGSAR